jgi:hypothetical protein
MPRNECVHDDKPFTAQGAGGAGADLGYCIAFSDFEAVEVGDLGFNTGDRIRILSKDQGWWWSSLFPPRTRSYMVL